MEAAVEHRRIGGPFQVSRIQLQPSILCGGCDHSRVERVFAQACILELRCELPRDIAGEAGIERLGDPALEADGVYIEFFRIDNSAARDEVALEGPVLQ